MRDALRVCTLMAVVLLNAVSAAAQAKEPPDPPTLLVIYREEVRPGKGAAHSANEQAWSGAFTKGQAPVQWLGMTTIGGPNEAWFLSGHESVRGLPEERGRDGGQRDADGGRRQVL